MNWFIVNKTGMPVHVRIDEKKGKRNTFIVTVSGKEVRGEKPRLAAIVRDKPFNVPFFNKQTQHAVNDKLRANYAYQTDDDGDAALVILSLLN